MIKNLIFDFGKVLVDYDFRHVVDQFFTDKDEEETFLGLFASPEFLDICDKEDTPFDDIIDDMAGRHPQYARQAELYKERYAEFVTNEVVGMREVLEEMRGRGYKLYGLTNWCSKVHEVMRRFSIFELLDGRVISSEEHLIKPDTAIYERLCERYGLKAEECVFADDKAVNVVGAISAGMKGIVFQNAKQYKRELEGMIREQR